MHTALLRLVVSGSFILMSYALCQRGVPKRSRRIAIALNSTYRRPLKELDQLVQSCLWVLILPLVCICTLFILRVKPSQLVDANVRTILLSYGVLVGLGEASVGRLLCYIALSLPWFSSHLARRTRLNEEAGSEVARWHTLGQKGLARFAVLTVIAFLLAAVEEIMLRGAMIAAAPTTSKIPTVAFCVVLSLLAQRFGNTASRNVLFSLIGTSVSAPIHGLLFLVIPDIRPLIIADLTVCLSTLF